MFKFVADVSAATIVGKRIIVPLIATPLAKKVETKMEKHHAGEAPKTDAKPQEETKSTDKQQATGKNLDVVSTGNTSTNLLDKYNK